MGSQQGDRGVWHHDGDAEHLSRAPAASRAARNSIRITSRLRQDRGDGGGNALVWLLVVPAVLALVFLGVQLSQTGFARSTAQAAAEAGVRAATSVPADVSRAAGAAEAFLAANAKSYLEGTAVSVTSTGTSVTVTVTGTARSLVGGAAAAIDQSASGALEILPGVEVLG